MSQRSFKITRVYVVPAEGKAEARDVLSAALQGKTGDPEAYLDFESIREVIPERGKSWRSEFRDQLFGPSSPVKPPATNGSRS
jgi:hypothetical protein